jgi:hypothetical protein
MDDLMDELRWRKSSRSGNGGMNCVEIATVWRKSSRSGNGGLDCVEVARQAHAVAVRDSKNPNGPKLTLNATAWQTLTRRIKAGRYDV